MILLMIALICAFPDIGFGSPYTGVCTDCEYSIGGIGYLMGYTCAEFRQCRRLPNGDIDEVLLCCPEGSRWNQDIKNCDYGHGCIADRSNCTNSTTYDDEPCNLWADEADQQYYFMHPVWDRMRCPPGTVYRQEYCGCVHGESYSCYDDPLLHFPFAKDFNDIQCPRAQGQSFGDSVVKDGYMKLDGDGDYMTFSFLNNWFVNNNPNHFTLSMWFKQTIDGFNNVNNFPEGLFSNGNCFNHQNVWLELQNETADGGMQIGGGQAEFDASDADAAGRNYSPPEVWCHIAIRYSGPDNEVRLFLNGHPVGDPRPVNGSFEGTMSDSSVGLAYIDCFPFFFTGGIDDVMVFVRYVSDAEMYNCVYGNGRTEGPSEKMYECPM